MGDTKLCPSCGRNIPGAALFCPHCGQKQETIVQKPENTVQTPAETIPVQTVESQTTESHSEADSQTTPDVGVQPGQAVQQQPSVETEFIPQQPVAPDSVAAAPQQPESPGSEPAAPNYAQGFVQPQQPQSGFQQQTQPVQNNKPDYAQQLLQAAAPQKPKKRFPWFFAIVWAGLLIFTAVWIILWFTYPESQNPLNYLTVDTFRILTPVVTIVLLIYTLNLKLIVKKGKFIPTILLVLTLLLSVFMFLSFELVEGDWAHDLIRPITEIFFEFE